MKLAGKALSIIFQSAAMSSALIAFFLVCFEDDMPRASLITILGIICVAIFYGLARAAGRSASEPMDDFNWNSDRSC